MLVVTTETISGKNLQMLGFVSGSTVQSKNAFKDIGAGFRNMVGGEVGSYTKMLSEARDVAVQRMIQQAQSMGADAVVNLRFSSSSVMQGAAEILAAGTAVKFV
ncbi:MAG: YbjQ family protein [Ruminococcus sp.]|nr:YbjQ family protein [Ruminococcus sp.]